MPYRVINRDGTDIVREDAKSALTALISMLDETVHQYRLTTTSTGNYDHHAWVKVFDNAEAALDAVISVYSNPQLDVFLRHFGLRLVWHTPLGDESIELLWES